VTSTARAVMLAALCLGVLLVGIELFITVVALPRIFFDLSGWDELRRASWIITAYLVAYIAAMPLAGRAADRFGLPPLMLVALFVFGVGSLICGASQSLEQLVLGRAVQGAGAGAILPLATAGASHLYSGHNRSRALGLIGAATFLGMAIGPVLGAVILEMLQLRDALASVGVWGGTAVDVLTPGWRWVFYITAPLSLLAGLYIWAASPDWETVRFPPLRIIWPLLRCAAPTPLIFIATWASIVPRLSNSAAMVRVPGPPPVPRKATIRPLGSLTKTPSVT
jgi:MFS family permease